MSVKREAAKLLVDLMPDLIRIGRAALKSKDPKAALALAYAAASKKATKAALNKALAARNKRKHTKPAKRSY